MVRVTVEIDDDLYLELLKVALKKYKKRKKALGLVLNEAIRLYLSEVRAGGKTAAETASYVDHPAESHAGTTAGATAEARKAGSRASPVEVYVREVYYRVVSKLGARPGSRVPVKALESALSDMGKDPSWISIFEKYGLARVEGEECVLLD